MSAAPPKIVVSTALPEQALEVLREVGGAQVVTPPVGHDMGSAELHEALPGAAALVCTVADRVDRTLLDAAGTSLRVVSTVSVGYDNIDLAAAEARGVTCTNTPGVLTDATADLTMGLLLMVTRRLSEGERLIRARRAWSFHLGFMLGTDLRAKTMGIVGLGQIGRAVALRARAFGMHIVYSGRTRAEAAVETELEAEYRPLPELLGDADVVSLHCPLTSRTHHLIGPAELATMRRDAFLLNTARGPVVDEGALAEALESGEIAGAGLDVFENEPAVEPRLLELENVALIPHLGSATTETRTAMAVLAARNTAAVLSGATPPTAIPAQ